MFVARGGECVCGDEGDGGDGGEGEDLAGGFLLDGGEGARRAGGGGEERKGGQRYGCEVIGYALIGCQSLSAP
jgi:hypothetical protein